MNTVRDLNSRLQDIKREQLAQREREMEFRDQSESTNSRVVKWTIIQLAVLLATCSWQLSHLQVCAALPALAPMLTVQGFFMKQKLV